ncbi:hypothetical protein BJF95_16275 [Rhizobium oryziradicis]|uniref:Uncharacterized protein n=1 Tax=Rhizobium oryziradicis TaxID=1867956 RepID=A0A1Q8ZWT0_9HYPH|nr:hypothetical protein BJF95_16275 [Rhizobium oryziradicis]
MITAFLPSSPTILLAKSQAIAVWCKEEASTFPAQTPNPIHRFEMSSCRCRSADGAKAEYAVGVIAASTLWQAQRAPDGLSILMFQFVCAAKAASTAP